jgi:hypothetical protein
MLDALLLRSGGVLRSNPGAVLPTMNNARSSSNRRRLAYEIGQQPVNPLLQKSANVLGMPDFIGCLHFFAF